MTVIVDTEAKGIDRDEHLRVAHRRAFDKIRAAAAQHRETLVSEAVDELLDACESYVSRR